MEWLLTRELRRQKWEGHKEGLASFINIKDTGKSIFTKSRQKPSELIEVPQRQCTRNAGRTILGLQKSRVVVRLLYARFPKENVQALKCHSPTTHK